jgi:hypothetical protein
MRGLPPKNMLAAQLNGKDDFCQHGWGFFDKERVPTLNFFWQY